LLFFFKLLNDSIYFSENSEVSEHATGIRRGTVPDTADFYAFTLIR